MILLTPFLKYCYVFDFLFFYKRTYVVYTCMHTARWRAIWTNIKALTTFPNFDVSLPVQSSEIFEVFRLIADGIELVLSSFYSYLERYLGNRTVCPSSVSFLYYFFSWLLEFIALYFVIWEFYFLFARCCIACPQTYFAVIETRWVCSCPQVYVDMWSSFIYM